MIDKQKLQLLELQARLASALGQLQNVVSCTICGAPITGPSQREHQVDCPLARELNVLPPKAEPKEKTSMDFSFGAKPKAQIAKPVLKKTPKPDAKKKTVSKKSKGAKRIVNKTGDQFRDANGKFDRSAWSRDKAAKRRAAGVPLFANKEQLMGLPAGIGGLG